MRSPDSNMYGLYAALPPLDATALSIYSCDEKSKPMPKGPGFHSGITLNTMRNKIQLGTGKCALKPES